MQMRPIDERLRSEHTVWVFTPSDGRTSFPCGVWDSIAAAEAWIDRVGASGTLSAYIVNESAYDSNVRLGLLNAQPANRQDVDFVRNYATAVDHRHYDRALSKD